MKTTPSSTSTNNYTLWIVYLNVILYATCFQIQRPLEPFLVEKLLGSSDSASEYARLQSFFSLIQTVGSLISGRFLDRFGAKGGFLISFGASALCYALLSQATTINILYASKIPTIFQSGFLCAQVAASQLTADGPERVKALGMLTMSYTIGSVLGPYVGGVLGASGDYYLGAKLAVAGSVLSMLLTLLMPSADAKDAKSTSQDENGKASKDMPKMWDIVSVVWLFLATKVISSVANAMSAAAFPLILKNNFGLNEKGLGLSMSIMSAVNAVVSGVFLEPIVKLMGSDLRNVISYCIFAMIALSALQAGLALPAVAVGTPGNGLYFYLGTTYVLSIFQYILATTITGESTARVGPNAKGTLLGLEHSLFAAARVVAPQMGVSILNAGGVPSVSGACAGVFVFVLLLWTGCVDRKTPNAYNKGSVVEETVERKEK